MSDESIINLSDSTKATMRNYAMVAGFMAILIAASIDMTRYISGSSPSMQVIMYKSVISIALILFGSILAFLHKRDLVAITFLMIGLTASLSIMGVAVYESASYGFFDAYSIVAIIIGSAMLFTRNEQKYICAAILILPSIITLISGLAFNANSIDHSTMMSINAMGKMIWVVICIYAVLCIGLENPKFPGYRMLTADEEDETKDGSPVHFKVSGSILGYMLLMIPGLTCIFYKLNLFGMGIADIQTCDCSCGLLLIVVGFLMLVAGRMKFTPFMFMMLGMILVVPSTEQINWLFTVFFIIVGIICIFRTDRRILVGVAIIMNGLALLFTDEGVLPNDAAILLFSAIAFIIYAYVCFALCSDNRLKLI